MAKPTKHQLVKDELRALTCIDYDFCEGAECEEVLDEVARDVIRVIRKFEREKKQLAS